MTGSAPLSIADHFGSLTDPRQHHVDHLLLEMITIAICGVICGADNWVEIEQFGQELDRLLIQP